MQYLSYIILGMMILIYFSSLNFYDTNNEALNYLARSFYHANLEHLIANGVSFYMLSPIENTMGTGPFLFMLIFIWVVSSMLLYLYHSIFPSRKVYTVGFSAVIFGMFVVYYTLLNKSPGVTVAGLLISIVPQLFVPGISYEGHICGIIAGLIYVLLFPVDKYRPAN